MPIGSPGCPELAFWTASMDSVRIVSIASWSMSVALMRLSITCRGRPALPRGDPQGLAQQVRVGRRAPGDQARPIPVLVRGLSHRLRIHSRHVRRGRRSARRHGVCQRADVPRLRDSGEGHRAVPDARRQGHRRQGLLRPAERSELEPHGDARRPAAAAARRDLALLLDLQAARGQARDGRRLVLARGGAADDRGGARPRDRAPRGGLGLVLGMSGVFRTPDERFAGLPGFGFAPRYAEVDGLRIAYLDEGPADGPPVWFMHGEPTWSFLWRKVFPAVVEAGHRAIVPDLPGFGRSDKPTDLDWYSYDR